MNWLPRLSCVGLALACIPTVSTLAPAQDRYDKTSMHVYIGTYTAGTSKGIYHSRLDGAGRLTPPELAAETKNPTFLAVHPNGRFLYAVAETSDFAGKRTGAVSAFRIEPQTGALTLLNQQPSGGAGPCHLIVDKTGRCVLVANYGGGSVAALPIQSDGSLAKASAFIQHTGSSVNPKRQNAPHAHFISPDPANRFALAADLGADKVFVYRFDARNGSLIPNDPPAASVKPGAGPRQLAFHPRGRFAYVINELDSTITAFAYDAKRGALEELHTVPTLPDRFDGNSTCAEIEVHPSGKFLYGSNRGHDSIAIFAIDPKSGRLTSAGHQSTQGRTPRHFGIDPAGKWLLAGNQGSDNIVVFSIDPKSGALKPTGQTVEVGSPVCVVFVPAD